MTTITARTSRRPPNLSLTLDSRPSFSTLIDRDSPNPPTVVRDDNTDIQSSSPESAISDYKSPYNNLRLQPASPVADPITKGLVELEQLRESVKQNLRLRPIRSSSNIRVPTMDSNGPASAVSSASPSVYYTPCEHPVSVISLNDSPTANLTPLAVSPSTLFELFNRSEARPLLIDTRPLSVHLTYHITNSINIAIPSLILKRSRKIGGSGFQSFDALRQFITTEQGKLAWDANTLRGRSWNGDVILYDQDMDPKDKENPHSPSWSLLPVIAPLLRHGTVSYLKGGMSAARKHPPLSTFITSTSSTSATVEGSGLFQLDTLTAARSKTLPDIEHPTPASAHSPILFRTKVPDVLTDNSPSPPPSRVGFRKAVPQKRPSAPNLRRIDTSSTERLNGNSKVLPMNGTLDNVVTTSRPFPRSKAMTLTIPPSHNSLSLTLQLPPPSPCSPRSPLPPSLSRSDRSPTTRSPSPSSSQSSLFPPPLPSPSFSFPGSFPLSSVTPHTPSMAFSLVSPSTVRPEDAEPTTEPEDAAFPSFVISTILPQFLYLGPELTAPEHVEELRALGIRRILNIAVECDDDHGLGLRETFERYIKIPMRDIVEEENIAKGVREVCEILDDARLHSAPTYVHCKAGKSRSVTAVMAYLIHANHWTLSQAYAFVLERRKGISPNIGFVSELMTFEEAELGGKSVGVQPTGSSSSLPESHSHALDHFNDEDDHHQHHHHPPVGGGKHGSYTVLAGNRRPAHVRESLPPVFQAPGPDDCVRGPPTGGMAATLGDAGQETEIKDACGRYRHARRAPVDENTLQPLRRVSKAGLESSGYTSA